MRGWRAQSTLSSLVDAGRRALLSLAVLEPQAATVQTLVAECGRASRAVVKVRPSSRSRASQGSVPHEPLELTPAVTAKRTIHVVSGEWTARASRIGFEMGSGMDGEVANRKEDHFFAMMLSAPSR